MGAEIFRDRDDAGMKLATELAEYADADACVLAIPRGGVPVGVRVATELNAGFDLIIPRKIPIPWNPEAGFGAITADGSMVLNESLVRELDLGEQEINLAAEGVRQEAERRAREYRIDRPPPNIAGKTAIIVDDGMASGYTMLAAIQSVERRGPASTIVAVPVASSGAVRLVGRSVDRLICLLVSERIPYAVASFYMRWSDLTDDDVHHYLAQVRRYCE